MTFPDSPSLCGQRGIAIADASRTTRSCTICILVGLLAGCSTTKPAAQTGANDIRYGQSTNASLALAAMNDEDAAELFDANAWEFARRDHELGGAGSPIESSISIAEIRMREHLRTSNGRPRNDSFTTSRSYQRRVGP